MTRWARGGPANKKKKNEASTWQELNTTVDDTQNENKTKMSGSSQRIVSNLRKIQKSDPAADHKAIDLAVKREVRSEHRRVTRIDKKDDSRICFACRKPGHTVADCPETKKMGNEVASLCFKCGSTEHSIAGCKVKGIPANAFPYATCFICKKTGHLSKQCVDNPRGLYPDGGSCRLCGSTEHFKKDCPDLVEASKCNFGDTITLTCISKDVMESIDDEPSLYVIDKEDDNQEEEAGEQDVDGCYNHEVVSKYKPIAKRKPAKVVYF